MQIERAVASMVDEGRKVSFAGVARRAGVSRWLTYQSPNRELVEAAQHRGPEDVDGELLSNHQHVKFLLDQVESNGNGDEQLLLLMTAAEAANQICVTEADVLRLIAEGELSQLLTIEPLTFVGAASVIDYVRRHPTVDDADFAKKSKHRRVVKS
jgi:hypothetical protein